MSNGIAKITLRTDGQDNETVILRYGMMGCAEFERRVVTNATPNPAKVLTDMIYAGMFGEAMRNEQPVPDYSDAVDLLDRLSEESDYKEQSIAIQKVYEESKFGKEFIEKNKKKVEELENMIQ